MKKESRWIGILFAVSVIVAVACGIGIQVFMRWGDSVIAESNKPEEKQPVATITAYEDKSHLNDFVEVNAEVTSVEGEFILILNDNIICTFLPCQNLTEVKEGDIISLTGTVTACGEDMHVEDCKLDWNVKA